VCVRRKITFLILRDFLNVFYLKNTHKMHLPILKTTQYSCLNLLFRTEPAGPLQTSRKPLPCNHTYLLSTLGNRMMNTKTRTNFIAADTNSILRRHLPPALFETNARRLNRCRNNSFLMKKHSDTLQRGTLKAVELRILSYS